MRAPKFFLIFEKEVVRESEFLLLSFAFISSHSSFLSCQTTTSLLTDGAQVNDVARELRGQGLFLLRVRGLLFFRVEKVRDFPFFVFSFFLLRLPLSLSPSESKNQNSRLTT